MNAIATDRGSGVPRTRTAPARTGVAWILALAFAGGLPTAGSAQAVSEADQMDTEALRILTEASERYESLQGFCADFRQSIDVTLLRETKRSGGELCWLRPDRFEMLFSDPQGDRIVADGADLWVYFPSTDPGQVFRTRLAETGGRYDLHREFLSDPGERYDATLEGTDELEGRRTQVLALTPIVASPYRSARIWIDPETDLIRKLEILEESESIRTVELSNMRLDPDVSQRRFRFEPPSDAQVIRR